LFSATDFEEISYSSHRRLIHQEQFKRVHFKGQTKSWQGMRQEFESILSMTVQCLIAVNVFKIRYTENKNETENGG
jgi:hypothetical protein